MKLVSIKSLLPPVAAAQEGAGGGFWAGLVWNELPKSHPYLCLSLQQEHSWHRPAETESTEKTEPFPKQWLCILPHQPVAMAIVGTVTMFFQKCFSTEPALKKKCMILRFPQNLHWFQWPRFKKVPTYALNFGLFCTLVKQTGREYFCPTEIKPFLTLLCRWLCLWAVWLASLSTRKAQSIISWSQQLNSTGIDDGVLNSACWKKNGSEILDAQRLFKF